MSFSPYFLFLFLFTVSASFKGRVFVGGTFDRPLRDMATHPSEWAQTAAGSGYWLHPMGFAAANQGGYLLSLLKQYGVKEYIYEADLMAWTDGTNPVQTNTPWVWGSMLEQMYPTMKQRFFAPWVNAQRLAQDLDDTVNRYAILVNKMKSVGKQNTFVFYAPPSPEGLEFADVLLNNRRDGITYLEYVVRHSGANGIALDYPASLYVSENYPKARHLALQAYQVAKKLNIKFAWVFNGNDANTSEAVNIMRQQGIHPNFVGVDDFANANQVGVPESKHSSLTGQALQIFPL